MGFRAVTAEDKELIPTEDMVQKVQAAVDAREDPNFTVVARTAARAVEGIEGAIARANRYADVGADMISDAVGLPAPERCGSPVIGLRS